MADPNGAAGNDYGQALELYRGKPPQDPERKLAWEIHNELALAERSGRAFVEHAIRVGQLLMEVKQRVGHGKYEAWVAENFPRSPRTARKYVRAAKQAEHHRAQLATGDAGGLEGALAQFAEPAPAERKRPLTAALNGEVADSTLKEETDPPDGKPGIRGLATVRPTEAVATGGSTREPPRDVLLAYPRSQEREFRAAIGTLGEAWKMDSMNDVVFRAVVNECAARVLEKKARSESQGLPRSGTGSRSPSGRVNGSS